MVGGCGRSLPTWTTSCLPMAASHTSLHCQLLFVLHCKNHVGFRCGQYGIESNVVGVGTFRLPRRSFLRHRRPRRDFIGFFYSVVSEHTVCLAAVMRHSPLHWQLSAVQIGVRHGFFTVWYHILCVLHRQLKRQVYRWHVYEGIHKAAPSAPHILLSSKRAQKTFIDRLRTGL
jgi:hypothetical protein